MLVLKLRLRDNEISNNKIENFLFLKNILYIKIDMSIKYTIMSACLASATLVATILNTKTNKEATSACFAFSTACFAFSTACFASNAYMIKYKN